MSEIRATTISDAAGTGPITLTKQSAAKVFCQFDGDAATPTPNESLNVSSITDNGTGDYTLTYSNSLTGVFSNIVACSQSGRSVTQRAMAYDSATASSFIMGTYIDAGSTQTAFDNTLNDAFVFGELA